uniref:Uncharacterized protein n=1 Tax=Shewanella sp. (strain MR-7) TaxID=60481 RepID=Q0HWW3_SHESR
MRNLKKLEDFIAFENEQRLWDETFFGVPLWYYVRARCFSDRKYPSPKYNKPSILGVVISFLYAIKLFFSRDINVYFIFNRREVLNYIENSCSKEDLVFLYTEFGTSTAFATNLKYVSCDFFNILRFIFRKLTWVAYRKELKRITAFFSEIPFYIGEDEAKSLAKLVIGEVVFNKFLSFFTKKCKIYYSGAIIPSAEKFMNLHNSSELQHGVIHSEHFDYSNVPSVRNRLIVHNKAYLKLLTNLSFSGVVETGDFEKEAILSFNSYNVVIFTQPAKEFEHFINNIPKKFFYEMGVYIQKHPRDYNSYQIPEDRFVYVEDVSCVNFPVLFSSSVIEKFCKVNKKVYIIELKIRGSKVQGMLDVYRALYPDFDYDIIENIGDLR